MGDPFMAGAVLDPWVAHPARVQNYLLAGKDNFAADRRCGDEIGRALPTIRAALLAHRAMQHRAVRFLAARAGIRQFLDVGVGLPTGDATHVVARAVVPHSRVVYVDNDPLVLSHARALLADGPEGETTHLAADLRRPDTILDHPALRKALDPAQPVALILAAVLQFIPGRQAARDVVIRLLDALPPGSYLVATQAAQDLVAPARARAVRQLADGGGLGRWVRDRAEFTALFEGLELIGPGVVPARAWWPVPGAASPGAASPGFDDVFWAGVARKS